MGSGWSSGRGRLHDLEGDAMKTEDIHPFILSLVTFVPLGSALLLLFFPRRDRDIKVFALVVSILTFILSLHLPVHFVNRTGGLPIRDQRAMDHHAEHSLPHGCRWLLYVAGGADHFPHAALRDDVVALGAWSGEGILHPASGAGNGDDRRLRFTRLVPLLLLLGSDADSDGVADRHIWPRAQCTRR